MISVEAMTFAPGESEIQLVSPSRIRPLRVEVNPEGGLVVYFVLNEHPIARGYVKGMFSVEDQTVPLNRVRVKFFRTGQQVFGFEAIDYLNTFSIHSKTYHAFWEKVT